MGYLLDTNIVTAIVKNNEPVKKKYRQLDSLGEDVSISCITYYEVKRGLLAVNATKKLSIFNRFCQEVTVLFLDDMEIVERASAMVTTRQTFLAECRVLQYVRKLPK